MSVIIAAQGETITVKSYASTNSDADFVAFIIRNGSRLAVIFTGPTRHDVEGMASAFWIAEVEKAHKTQEARAQAIASAQAARTKRKAKEARKVKP
jgi:predicted ATP-grasp superfamily ATP-dependent carboligase